MCERRVDGEIAGQMAGIRRAAVRGHAQAAAVEEVSAHLRIAKVIVPTARQGVFLVMIEVDIVLADVVQLIGAKQGLARIDVASLRLLRAGVEEQAPVFLAVDGR
ncbi:hypothetical protein D3C81_1283930 [compost metagenome]